MHLQSRYTDTEKQLTPAQWLAELMCERKAKSERKDLPVKFWDKKLYPEWAKEWVKQAIIANRLLKKYSFEAIVAALKNPKALKIYSLGATKMLTPLIEQAQKQIDNKPQEAVVVDTLPTNVKTTNVTKSLINKLR